MMRTLFVAILSAGLALFSGAALAQGAMDVTFGNTVSVTDASGTLLASYHFDADGAFTLVGADGTSTAGTWTEVDGEVCMTMGESTGCNPTDGSRAVGDSWEDTDTEGNTITITIVAGR